MRYEFVKRAVTTGSSYAFAAYCLYLSIVLSLAVFATVTVIYLLDKKYMSMIISKRMSQSFERMLEILASYVAIPGNFLQAFSQTLIEYQRVYTKDELNPLAKRACSKASANLSTEQVLIPFAKEMDIEEGYLFCESIIICEKKGGDLNKTIKETIAFIKEKTTIEHEIELITAEKRTERIIVSICPFLILALFHSIGTGYLDVLYEGLIGRGIMTISGLLFFLSGYAAKKILEVKV